MFQENQSLIRYWESEFDILQPKKNKKGDRYFRPVDVKNLVLIYDLLRRRKFTIEGARDFLKKNKKEKNTHDCGYFCECRGVCRIVCRAFVLYFIQAPPSGR